MSDSPTPLTTRDAAVRPFRGPRLWRSALVGTLLTLSMLYLDWVAAPIVERLIVGQDAESGQFLTLTQLRIDLVFTFAVQLALMLVVVRSRRLYGIVITVSMSLISWFVYFAEVGWFAGMLSSLYPLLYEWIAFFTPLVACAVALLIARRSRVPVSVTTRASVGTTIVHVAKMTALVCWLVVSAAVGIAFYRQRDAVAFEVQKVPLVSTATRALRCQGVRRPMLVDSTDPWSLEYSWAGGMGPGTVRLLLRSDGQATFEHQALNESEPTVSTVPIPAQSVASIARHIDDSALLCLDTIPRDGYRVFDIGRITLTVRQGAFEKAVVMDECHTVADPRAMGQVIAQVYLLQRQLGPQIAWGPYATSSVPSPCTNEEKPK